MAESAEKNTNKLIAIIVAAVLVVVAAVVAIVLINKNKGEVLDENFFKTSDSKIVLAFNTDTTTSTTGGPVAKKMYQVYTIDGDKITGLKVYSEFEDEAQAKEADANPAVEEAVKNGSALDHKVNGKYLIATMPESLYSALTVEQLKATAETLEKAINNAMEQQKEEAKTETKTEETVEATPAEATSTEETVETVSEDEE